MGAVATMASEMDALPGKRAVDHEERQAKRARGNRAIRGAKHDDVNALEKILIEDGVVCMQGLYAAEQLAQWQEHHKTLLAQLDKEISKTQRKEQKYLNPVGGQKAYSKQGYWQVPADGSFALDVGYGRHDFTYGCEEGPFADSKFHAPDSVINLMNRMLKADYAHYNGAVPSRGKSGQGFWHRDTYSLFDNEELDVTLPPFYFTMLVPFKDVTEELGPTQFLLGSHRLANVDADEGPHLVGLAKAGDAVIFDGRMLHRGLANPSENIRELMYMVYHKKWYRDYLNDEFKAGFSVNDPNMNDDLQPLITSPNPQQ